MAKKSPFDKFLTDEQKLQRNILRYLEMQYRSVIFFHIPNEGKRTPFERYLVSIMGNMKGIPDIFIAAPKLGFYKEIDRDINRATFDKYVYVKHGFFLELKVDRSKVYNKNGTMKKDEHIRHQWSVILQLRKLGYEADFGFGFDDSKKKIDDYLKI